jgi:hypothetical protein
MSAAGGFVSAPVSTHAHNPVERQKLQLTQILTFSLCSRTTEASWQDTHAWKCGQQPLYMYAIHVIVSDDSACVRNASMECA